MEHHNDGATTTRHSLWHYECTTTTGRVRRGLESRIMYLVRCWRTFGRWNIYTSVAPFLEGCRCSPVWVCTLVLQQLYKVVQYCVSIADTISCRCKVLQYNCTGTELCTQIWSPTGRFLECDMYICIQYRPRRRTRIVKAPVKT
jgi:hypothetical protein